MFSISACKDYSYSIVLIKYMKMLKMLSCLLVCAGEFHSRRNPWHDGQEAEYPQHVRYSARRPRQVHANRLSGIKSRYHCWCQGW